VTVNVLILHGPNLNLLGEREPDLYGTMTLAELDERLAVHAGALGMTVRCAQSNSEGELVDLIQDAKRGGASAIVINPGGYSHTSVAIRDAIAAVGLPAIEVHLSNPNAREWFRQTDLVAGACSGVIAGFGWRSYAMALEALARDAEADSGADGGAGGGV
jgi:3-dehydroquinate dehydratase II